MATLIPVSLVIPTKDRAPILRRALESVAIQSAQPAEIILIDASTNNETHASCVADKLPGLESEMRYARATLLGAAVQRNQGVDMATHDVIGFCDDDVILEPECITRLWNALKSDPGLGGVNAMITNQRYHRPGLVSRTIFTVMAGEDRPSFAGGMLGPAINLLPDDDEALPAVVPVEWLNLGLTFYRREALPSPPFAPFFTGYSMMEDATLSSVVARKWKLANARTARLFHDSQAGQHKSDPVAIAKMELVNRHYVMTRVLGRNRWRDYGKLLVWESFQLVSNAVRNRLGHGFRAHLRGRMQGLREILR